MDLRNHDFDYIAHNIIRNNTLSGIYLYGCKNNTLTKGKLLNQPVYHRACIFPVHPVFLLHATIQKQAIGNEIDAARDATAVLVNKPQGYLVNRRVTLPSNAAQAVLDIIDSLVEVQRIQRGGGHQALLQVLHTRRADELQQALLTYEEDL